MTAPDFIVSRLDGHDEYVVGQRCDGLIVAAFFGMPPELSQQQWSALLEARNKAGRMLFEGEAVEVIRDAQ